MTATSRPDNDPYTSQGARDLGWLLSNFTQRTVGVSEAIAVSADGFLLASSAPQAQDGTEQFAAIVSGLTSLTKAGAELYGSRQVRQVVVEMDLGFFFIMSINDGSTIGVLASVDCDVGAVGYELALLIDRVGAVLTPALVDELKNTVYTKSSLFNDQGP
jgi:predicted regulator of Ras-like GTPase activity (Roadblock/LC7/MglB family)